MLDSRHLLFPAQFPALRRSGLVSLQVNLGYRCNQTCLHCHVNAGPTRTESMVRETIDQVLECLRDHAIQTLDLTGGAPELNPHFRYLVEQASAQGVRVVDRCNLTILEESGQEGLAEFLALHRVEVVASLPCYLEGNVDGQRGRGVYETSIRGLQRLNRLGYGGEGTGLMLNLVYNPPGPSLPPSQQLLEADYKRELAARYGIRFNQLFTITNMPIQRFGSRLQSHGEFEGYMQLLRDAFVPANLSGVMCLNQLSVDWRGYLYDCDFNQMLDLPLRLEGRSRTHIGELPVKGLAGVPIQVGEHCYGCTAGQGSSCGGALDPDE
jgi:radical SAM/Cys-rich protein